jgi:hypothetical protein
MYGVLASLAERHALDEKRRAEGPQTAYWHWAETLRALPLALTGY